MKQGWENIMKSKMEESAEKVLRERGRESKVSHTKDSLTCGASSPQKAYYLPPKWEQASIIANTPHWLRVHFEEKAREEVLKEVEEKVNELPSMNKCPFYKFLKCKDCTKLKCGLRTNECIKEAGK